MMAPRWSGPHAVAGGGADLGQQQASFDARPQLVANSRQQQMLRVSTTCSTMTVDCAQPCHVVM
jgi:hypothetical protein